MYYDVTIFLFRLVQCHCAKICIKLLLPCVDLYIVSTEEVISLFLIEIYHSLPLNRPPSHNCPPPIIKNFAFSPPIHITSPAQWERTGFLANKSSNQSCARGMFHKKIHLIAQVVYSRLQCKIVA